MIDILSADVRLAALVQIPETIPSLEDIELAINVSCPFKLAAFPQRPDGWDGDDEREWDKGEFVELSRARTIEYERRIKQAELDKRAQSVRRELWRQAAWRYMIIATLAEFEGTI